MRVSCRWSSWCRGKHRFTQGQDPLSLQRTSLDHDACGSPGEVSSLEYYEYSYQGHLPCIEHLLYARHIVRYPYSKPVR